MCVNMIAFIVLLTVGHCLAAKETENNAISIPKLREKAAHLKESQQFSIDTLAAQDEKLEAECQCNGERHLRQALATVAFSAVLTKTVNTAAHNSPIPFNKVYTDSTHGFDNSTGVYTVTRPGLYQLYTSVAVDGNDAVHAYLVKNSANNVLCTCSAVHYSTGSCMVIVSLTEADRIWVMDIYGVHVRGLSMTTFTGVCLDC